MLSRRCYKYPDVTTMFLTQNHFMKRVFLIGFNALTVVGGASLKSKVTPRFVPMLLA